MSLQLPVSIGEALDKLSILAIKLENIKDSRRDDVLVEYNLLHELLFPYVNKYNVLYTLMKNINSKLWDLLSEQRNPDLSTEEYGLLSKRVVEENDARFRTKDKINMIAQSIIKERKGYNLSSMDVILTSNDYEKVIVDVLNYSVYYDIINISFSKEITDEIIEKVKSYFCYDLSVRFN